MSSDVLPAMKGPKLDAAKMRNLSTVEDVNALLNEAGISSIVQADRVIGDGFALLEKKDRLEGVKLLFLSWTFADGDYGNGFVSARVVTMNEGQITGKYIINDGGTGIHQQLQDFTRETGVMGGLYVARGLRASHYMYTDDDGSEKPATTWYIDTSAE